MEFISLEFIFVFLPVFVVVYITSRNYVFRLVLILATGIVFILSGESSSASLLWLLLVSCLTYGVGILIEKSKQDNVYTQKYLWGGIFIIVCILAFFKLYSGGFGDGQINLLVCENRIELFLCNERGLYIPLGISFLSFQAISYLVDVSKKQTSHEKNPFKFLAWSLFFPKLTSGPLVSYKNIQVQLNLLKTNINDVAAGLRLIFIGIIKRVLIASQVGIVADAVFSVQSSGISPLFAWMGLLAYSIQIYFDFSGYTNIAIGLGKIVGIQLPENFNYPYMADSVTDFWRRWHITLSTWFREYVFFPLERKRWKYLGRHINILIVFTLTGLWHGISINFLIWGLLHGFAIVAESMASISWQSKIPKVFRHFFTLAIVLLGWVFFRSPSLTFAIEFIKRLVGISLDLSPLPFSITTPLPFIEPTFILALITGIVFSMPIYSLINNFIETFKERNKTWFITIQLVQDFLLLFFFILAIAAYLTGSFAPDIYANF